MGDVMFNKFLIIMTFSALSLFGCGGGGTTTPSSGTSDTPTLTPTDRTLDFSLFEPDYFGGGYSVAFSLTGSDTKGDTYTATQTVESGVDIPFTTFFKPVKEIIVSTMITKTDDPLGDIDIVDKKYFTYETDIRLIASDNFDGIRALATTVSLANTEHIIPLKAKIGDDGIVGDFYRDFDTSGFRQTWELTDGFNGKAILIVTTVPDDITTDTYPTTVEKFLISQDGTVSGYELIITYHASNNTITLTN